MKKNKAAAAPSGNAIINVAPGQDGEFRITEIAQIRKSPDNRKQFNEDALQELAASIKSMGVAQPILIRPVTPTVEQPELYEIVAGERRYRASIIAGVATIPTMVRTLSDVDAAKIRILENLQRENPHPLEEAEGYEQLMMKHGYTAPQLVDEIKKSRAYVYGRLKLCALTSLVREQFLLNKISASTALLIARIAVPSLQFQAYKEIMRDDNPNWHPMSHRDAANHIQSRYMLDLTQATFQMSDAKLLTTAGSCVKCPKRTGNQPEVFADVSADICTDPDCFAEKKGAVIARVVVDANKKGIPVLDDAEQGEAFVNSGEYSKGNDYVSDVGGAPRDSSHYYTPVERVLDPKDMPAVKALIKDNGRLVAVYEKSDLKLALQAAGVYESVEQREARLAEQAKSPEAIKRAELSTSYEAEQAALREEAKRETDYRVGLYKKLRSHGEAKGFSVESLRELVKMMLHLAPLPEDILRDVYDFDTSSDESISAHIDQAGLPEVQLLLVDIVVGESLSVSPYEIKNGCVGDDTFNFVDAMCTAEGIDPAVEREAMHPCEFDVASMDGNDLVRIIKATPQRINELSKAILGDAKRFDLISELELAASAQGFVYGTDGWTAKDQPAAQSIPGATVTDVAADEIEQLQVEPSGDSDNDAAQLAVQIVESEAKAVPKSKASKSKPAVYAGWPFPKSGNAALASTKGSEIATPIQIAIDAADPSLDTDNDASAN